jgi:hypothetical protein
MSRYRDDKGRFIYCKISKTLEKKQQETPPPHTNSSKICARKILRGKSSKEAIEAITKGTKSEVIVQIERIIEQERGESLVTPSEGGVGKETEVVI